MKKSIPVIFLFLLLTSAAFAGELDENMTRVMNKAGFAPQQISRVQQLISVAKQKGLPEKAIAGKVHEGIAKGIAPENIVRATERVTSRYEYGYDLAERLADNKQQVARLGNTVAAGIAAGLQRRDAEKIVNSLHSKSQGMDRKGLYSLAEETLLTARDMSRRGVSSATTAEVVGKAVEKGFDAHGMRTMRRSFSRHGGPGNAESLAMDYGKAIEQGVEAGGLGDHDGMEGRGTGERGGSEAESGHGGGDTGGSGSSGGSGGGGSGGGGGNH